MEARATYAYAMNKNGGGGTGDMRAFAPLSAVWDALTRLAPAINNRGEG